VASVGMLVLARHPRVEEPEPLPETYRGLDRG
jgi:hypothetical protein